MTFIKWITIGMVLKGLSMIADCILCGTDVYQAIVDMMDTPKKKIQFFLGVATSILIWPISIINIIICLVYNLSQK